eukprot:6551-Chlamydomonas_euryale.AAC.2
MVSVDEVKGVSLPRAAPTWQFQRFVARSLAAQGSVRRAVVDLRLNQQVFTCGSFTRRPSKCSTSGCSLALFAAKASVRPASFQRVPLKQVVTKQVLPPKPVLQPKPVLPPSLAHLPLHQYPPWAYASPGPLETMKTSCSHDVDEVIQP